MRIDTWFAIIAMRPAIPQLMRREGIPVLPRRQLSVAHIPAVPTRHFCSRSRLLTLLRSKPASSYDIFALLYVTRLARTLLLTGSFGCAVLAPMAAEAQTRGVRDTATAYGARLNAKGQPANLNPNRINNRVNSRIENRLALRVERYRVENTSDPAAAFAAPVTDNSRTTPVTIAPVPRQGGPARRH